MWGPTLYDTGYYTYANPYCVEPFVLPIDGGLPPVTLDYTQPLVTDYAPSGEYLADTTDNPPAESLPAPDQTGLQHFEDARNAFYGGDYGKALSLANRALGSLPNDSTLHEFRALVLFATGEYRQAAAAINSVLASGPGWDWTTMSGLYASTDTYTDQLRKLEAYTGQNPDAAFAHFLLAYQYITCGYQDEAIAELEQTVRLEPSDQVAAGLLGNLKPADAAATPGEASTGDATTDATTDAIEIDPEALFGRWSAQPNPGTRIGLELGEDGNFRWIVEQGKKKHELKGSFSLAGDKLMLQPEKEGPMVGAVTFGDDGSFNFRIMGAAPGDKGLTFKRS
jgi:tetratricopeptide (TPR) repeat protein